MKTIDILLCENDEQGRPSGRLHRIDFMMDDEIILQLEAKDLEKGEPVHTSSVAGGATIQMYGFSIKTDARSSLAGNMLWNSYTAQVGYALGFLNLIKDKGNFTATEGNTQLYNAFNAAYLSIIADDFGIDEDVEPLLLNPAQTEISFNPPAVPPIMRPVISPRPPFPRISPLGEIPYYTCNYCHKEVSRETPSVLGKLDKDINGIPVNGIYNRVCADCQQKTTVYCIQQDCWKPHYKREYCEEHYNECFFFCKKCSSEVFIAASNCLYNNCLQGHNEGILEYLKKYEDLIRNEYRIGEKIKDKFSEFYCFHVIGHSYSITPIWIDATGNHNNKCDDQREPDYWQVVIIAKKNALEQADIAFAAAGYPKQTPISSEPYEDPTIPKIIGIV